jgi:hypothetical protein
VICEREKRRRIRRALDGAKRRVRRKEFEALVEQNRRFIEGLNQRLRSTILEGEIWNGRSASPLSGNGV